MQNIGDPRRKIKCCCRSSSSPAFLCISKNYFHPFQSPWNCSLSRGFKVELEMFLIKFFLRVRLIHTNCPVLHWKNKTWQRKSKLTLLKTLCECMCFQGSCSIVWVWSLGQPGRIRRMGVAAKSPRARGKRQIRGRHLRQMVTQGFSYNGHWIWRLGKLFESKDNLVLHLFAVHCILLICGSWIRIFSYVRAQGWRSHNNPFLPHTMR